ncbi:MAG: peptidoglycan DD-metalloendopeptidase family protein [Acidimicrobiales bacterium]
MAVRPAARRVVTVLVAVSVATTALVVLSAPVPAAALGGGYQPPVDDPIVDPFRVPTSTFGPGNRGLTYDLVPGTLVRASAPGEVVFAGPVAGTLHVTVLHADGLRTSYSFLDSTAARRGQVVEAGDVIGAGSVGFHFGVRDGTTYLDPAALFGGTEIRVRLVPHEEPLPPTDAGLLRERIALLDVVDDRNAVQRFLGRAAGIAGGAIDTFKAGLHTYDQIGRIGPVIESFGTVWDRWGQACTPASEAAVVVGEARADGRMALLVAGYGSDSELAGIDGLATDDLGYRDGDVLRYSYAGGRTPDLGGELDPALVGIPARPYGPDDTFGDLVEEGRELADLLQELAEARPGVPIDLYAHSQGGIVARLALGDLANRPGGLDALGQVVTIGTPHDGADLATIGAQLRAEDHRTIDVVTGVAGASVDSRAVSVSQMSETSDLIGRLQDEGVPGGVDFRTIGARGDFVVTGDKTTVEGHPSAMLDLFGPAAHNDLPASSGTTTEIALGLAGLPPGCDGILDTVLDAVVSEGISYGQNAVGAGILIG